MCSDEFFLKHALRIGFVEEWCFEFEETVMRESKE